MKNTPHLLAWTSASLIFLGGLACQSSEITVEHIKACSRALDEALETTYNMRVTEFRNDIASALRYSYDELSKLRETGRLETGASISVPIADFLLTLGGEYDSAMAREAYKELHERYSKSYTSMLSYSDLRLIIEQSRNSHAFKTFIDCLRVVGASERPLDYGSRWWM